MGLHDTLQDLELRFNESASHSAAGRLTSGILAEVNASSPLSVEAREFNLGAERFYRTTLRQRQIEEALGLLAHDCSLLDREQVKLDEKLRKALLVVLQGQDAYRFVEVIKDDVLHERADISTLKRLMNLILVRVHHDETMASHSTENQRSDRDGSPVYRAG
jgi:hypothetical protein